MYGKCDLKPCKWFMYDQNVSPKWHALSMAMLLGDL